MSLGLKEEEKEGREGGNEGRKEGGVLFDLRIFLSSSFSVFVG